MSVPMYLKSKSAPERAVVGTLSIGFLLMLVLAAAVTIHRIQTQTAVAPPIPVILGAATDYNQWLVDYYTAQGVQGLGYSLNDSQYQSLVDLVQSEMVGSRVLEFSVNDSVKIVYLTIYTSAGPLSAVGGPVVSIEEQFYVSYSGTYFKENFGAVVPLRYPLIETVMGVVIMSSPGGAGYVTARVDSVLEPYSGLSGFASVYDVDNVSQVSVTMEDCAFQSVFSHCLTYYDSEIVYDNLPNLTVGFSSPA